MFLCMERNIRPSICYNQTLVKFEVIASVQERPTFFFATLIKRNGRKNADFDEFDRGSEAVTSNLTKVRLQHILGPMFLFILRNPASASMRPQNSLITKVMESMAKGL